MEGALEGIEGTIIADSYGFTDSDVLIIKRNGKVIYEIVEYVPTTVALLPNDEFYSSTGNVGIVESDNVGIEIVGDGSDSMATVVSLQEGFSARIYLSWDVLPH